MKKNMILIICVAMVFVMVGCEESSTVDAQQRRATEELMQEAQNQVGMPNIKYFTERKMAKEILELCDDPELITYLYTQNIEGKLVYQGRGIGFGMPYSVQYTNPMRHIDEPEGGDLAIPQADPSGLFKPEGLATTWYMMIDDKTGETKVEQWEPNIIVKQNKAPRRLCAEWSLPEDY